MQCGCPNVCTEFCPLYSVTCCSCFVFGFNIQCNGSGHLLRRTARVGDCELVFNRVLTAFVGVALYGGYAALVSQKSGFSAR